MAIQQASQSYPINGNNNFLLVSWLPLANGDSGDPFILSQYSDRSVQINGTFGAGGTVVLQGTNDGVNYTTLTDNQGNALSFTSTKLVQVMEICVAIRPLVTAGDGTTAINVNMLVRK